MKAFPEVFDDASVNLIQAGEATGGLGEVLQRLIDHLTERQDLQRRVVAALAYPAALMFVAGGVVLFFLFFLLPRLKTLFDALRGELPLPTRILVAISETVLHYGPFAVAGLSVAAVMAWGWRKSPQGRLASDRQILRLPAVSDFAVAQTVLAISQTLSVLLENGITTSEALRMTGRQIGNRVHQQAFQEASERVMEGEALSTALGRTGCFPDLVLDQLSIGENTGNIVPSLKKIAKAYQQKVSDQLHLATRVLASGVLTSVFLFVGFLAYAIVKAVFALSASFRM
jgi:general secretion pathway protein F